MSAARPKRFISAILALMLCVVIGLGFWQRVAINDWWQLRNYSPPSDITLLAVNTTMTTHAQHDFYVNHPQLESKAIFNQNCPNNSEQTIILGCYHNAQRGIFLYSVSDSRLNGIEEVTAAHEMLHAAYDRLNSHEKKYVNGLLNDFYAHGLHDQRIQSTIAAYRKTEPNDIVNEMHSVFGTEVSQLPPALETYYRQYFTNRSKIADYAATYQAEFVSREKEVSQDDAQLHQLNIKITANELDIVNKLTQLKSIKADLDAKNNTQDFAAYNAGIAAYNVLVNQYNSEIISTKQLIAQYNQLLNQRNAIAVQEQQLQQAIDSHLTPVNQQ